MAFAPRGDLFARVMGFLVFLAGVGVIVMVLSLAFQMFHDPNLGVSQPAAAGGPSAAAIGIGFGRLLARIALLFLASICGSLIANKGIHLYFSGLHGGRAPAEAPAPRPEKPAPPAEP